MKDPLDDEIATGPDPLDAEIQSNTEPSFLDKLSKGSGVVRTTLGVARGVGDVVAGIPTTIRDLMSLPSKLTADVKALGTEPGAAKRIGGETIQAILGMAPYQQTVREALSGNIPSEDTFSRESGQLLGSVMLPKIGGGLVKRGTRAAVKELPGAGVELQQMASEKAGGLARSLEPGTQAVRQAYADRAAIGGNPTIDISPLRTMADRIRQHEGTATKPNTALIGQMDNVIKSGETGWDMDYALSEYRRMGEQKRALAKTGEVTQEIKDLYGSMRDVIENPQGIKILKAAQPARPASTILGPGGQPEIPAQAATPAVTQIVPPTAQMQAGSGAWTAAQKLAHRQFSVEEMMDRVNKAAGVSGAGFRSYSPNAVVKWIEQQEAAASLGHPNQKAQLFVSGFEPGELATIKSGLRGMTQDMAALPTLRGTPVGSSQRVLLGALGEIVGQATGHPVVGGLTGIAGGEAISRIMQTDAGRGLVRRAMAIDPTVGPKFWATLAPGFQYGANQRQPASLSDILQGGRP